MTKHDPINESELFAAVVAFGNGEDLPSYLSRLPGAFASPPGAVVDRSTGKPVDTGREARRTALRADLNALASGRLSRKRRREIAEASKRVPVMTMGRQRRPAYVDPPDLQSALGYVLDAFIPSKDSKKLAQCKLAGCGRFFLRETRQARPECYCSPEHAKRGKAEAAKQRSRNRRIVLKAIEELKPKYPVRAPALVKAARGRGESGLTVEALIRRAEALAAKRSV